MDRTANSLTDAFIRDLVGQLNLDPRDRAENWNMWRTGPDTIDGLGLNERDVRNLQNDVVRSIGRNRTPQEELRHQEVLTDMPRLAAEQDARETETARLWGMPFITPPQRRIERRELQRRRLNDQMTVITNIGRERTPAEEDYYQDPGSC